MSEPDDLAIVFAGDTVQADLVRSVLESSGIRVFLKDEAIGTLAPWQVSGGGIDAVKILVPESEKEKAHELLKEMENRRRMDHSGIETISPSSPREPIPGISNKWVVSLGILIGEGANIVLVSILWIVSSWVFRSQGVPVNELGAHAYQSTAYLITAGILGFASFVFAGGWCARFAPESALRTSFFSGILLFCFCFVSLLVPYGPPVPSWVVVSGFIIPLVAYPVGAILYRKRYGSRQR